MRASTCSVPMGWPMTASRITTTPDSGARSATMKPVPESALRPSAESCSPSARASASCARASASASTTGLFGAQAARLEGREPLGVGARGLRPRRRRRERAPQAPHVGHAHGGHHLAALDRCALVEAHALQAPRRRRRELRGPVGLRHHFARQHHRGGQGAALDRRGANACAGDVLRRHLELGGEPLVTALVVVFVFRAGFGGLGLATGAAEQRHQHQPAKRLHKAPPSREPPVARTKRTEAAQRA